MLKSVISVPTQAPSKRVVEVENSKESAGVKSNSHEKSKDKRLPFRKGHNGGENANSDGKSGQRKRSPDDMDLPTSNTSKKSNEGRKRTRSGGHHSTVTPTSGLRNQTVKITSIDGKTQLRWPAESVRHTDCMPVISYSSNPSFYDHSIALSREEEKRRTDLFIISDLIDDMVEDILFSERVGSRSHRKKRSKKSRKRSKKSKDESAKKADEGAAGVGEQTDERDRKISEKSDEANKKHKKSKRHKKSKAKKTNDQSEVPEIKTLVCPGVSTKTSPGKPSPVKAQAQTSVQADHALEPAAKDSPSDSKTSPLSNTSVNKTPKKGKRAIKKKITPSAAGSVTEKDAKKPKVPKKEDEKSHSLCKQDAKTEPSQKIKIAFSGNVSKPTTSAKSKWDTSSDEEGSSRKGAISYRFSDDSDADKDKPPLSVKEEVKPPKPEIAVPVPKPFGRMQPGGMLQTIELHNPLPDLKPSVPLAHPNPGPDGTRARTRSKTRSRSRTRSKSSRRSRSYSSDDSHYRSKRRHRKRSRRSYSRSYSRSRSGSYTSYSRSRSRSYSRSYSRSTSRSRSRSRYRSSSRSSYSSYTSYSSRSRSRSPIYTRAPKYNKTRAVNMGKRKRFKKKQFKNQQPQQNPAIQRQLETGRAKAEETVMRLKRQKEEQQELQNRAMASIAAAASSAGISLPTTTPPTTKQSITTSTTTTNTTYSGPSTPSASATDSQQQNGGDLVESFKEASHSAQAPAFVPHNLPPREFIGPVRPGVDPESDIPLPLGTPTTTTSANSRDSLMQQYQRDPEPMQAPDNQDEIYKNLQEQAVKHIMANTADSPGAEQLQLQHQHHLAAAQYASLVPETTTQIMIDPLTGHPVQVAAVQAAHAVHHHHQQQQLVAANGGLGLGLASQLSVDGQEIDDSKPAPHEAVIKSYADQVIMSNHKALVSQSQPVFTIAAAATGATSVPQAGVPVQSAPLMVNPAQAAQLQLQAQLQQAQAAQAQAQAVHLHNLQVQAAMQQQQQQLAFAQPHIQQLLVQQQLMQQAQAAQQPQLVQLPNGQIVFAAQNPQNILLQRFPRPM